MDLLTSTVVVCEQNKTRADLYALWLDGYDSRTALTKRQVDETIDNTVAVVVLDQGFGDGAAESVLELVRSRAPACRVVATRDRSAAFPELGLDHSLVKPVFEDELTEQVETLVCRTNYQLSLELYYRTTAAMSTVEFTDDGADDEQYKRLKKRAERLQSLLTALQDRLTDDELSAVMRNIRVSDTERVDRATEIDTKYCPDRCSHCGQDWMEKHDGKPPVERLGAYVWRCSECGHVQVHTDPSHQNIDPYRK
jgi:DNA-binding response OmpR family regulator